jgi:hypothetical protein
MTDEESIAPMIGLRPISKSAPDPSVPSTTRPISLVAMLA